ncbi:MAG: hypothetical protein KC731_11275 [Myxococcales bacterium]|nr:hypothetical protein [Myxococcales bacterium]
MELAWDDTDVTVVRPESRAEPPTLPPPRPLRDAVTEATSLREAKTEVSLREAKTEVSLREGKTEVTEVRDPPSAVTSLRGLASAPPDVDFSPLRAGKTEVTRITAPVVAELDEADLLPDEDVHPLAVTEVEGDNRQTWNFLKITLPVPMIRATQALPLVRIQRQRRRRLINVIPWLAMLSGAVSAVALSWWLTLPKAPAAMHGLLPAAENVTHAVAGFAVDGPAGVKVTVDGVPRGELPLRLEGLAPGRHHVVFDGRPTGGVLVRDITLEPGSVMRLQPVSL